MNNNNNHFFHHPRHMSVDQLAALPNLIEIEMYDGITVEHDAGAAYEVPTYSVDIQSLENMQDEEEERAARRMTRLKAMSNRSDRWN